MNNLINKLRSWRVAVLAVLGVISTILIISEAGSKSTALMCMAVKAAGFGIAYIVYRLFKHWERSGKIDGLTALVEGEE